ncbi:hypothetical protein IC575_006482 [Cucumis melo]
MDPMQTESLGGKKYVLVVVDDYSRFTWVRFLKGKLDTVKLCISLCLNLQREKRQKIIRIHSDHGKEFDNEDLNNFCQTEGIHHEFAAPITPQQNGVVEYKNRTLQEMARIMIHAKNLPLNFLAEAVNTACHIYNSVTTRYGTLVTLYELWKGWKPNVKYFHIFGSTCYILVDREYHRKWDVKSDQGIFLGYSQNSRAYRVFNIKFGTVMEIINVVINDFESNVNQFNIEDDETYVTPDVTSTPLDEMPKGDSQPNSANTNSNITDEVINNETVLVPSAHVKKNHPSSSIIGDSSTGVTTRRKEKLLQFKSNNVWTLVPKPDGANIIGTKWIFKNKTDESGSVIRNKACLVAQGYAQVEGVDFDETFAPVYVYTLNKALYGLKQAPRAWYERLTMYLGKRGYSRGETDKTLFINKTSTDLIVAQIYVDDIIFGGFPKTLVNNFINIMKSEFEMSLVGELSCFLGLQIKQRSEGMFISQEKYVKNLVKKFGLYQSQYKKTPAATHAKITKDTIGTAVDHKLYRSMVGSLLYLIASRPDIDYAVGICVRYQSDPRTSHLNAVKRIIKYVHGTTDFRILYSYDTSSELVGYCDAGWEGSADDRKSTFGGCFFLGNNLVSWFSKKQNCVPLSSAEAEYIVAGSGCTQMIWMKNMFK